MTNPPRNRGWLWYLLIVFGLAAIAVAILILFNLGQQLKAEDLQAARQLWKQKGPRDYRLVYTMKESGSPGDYFVIQVKDGKTLAATVNGKEPPDQLEHYGMDRLFELIEENLRQDAQSRVFTRARFDPDNGHLRWYVRSPRGKPRLEINVETFETETGRQSK